MIFFLFAVQWDFLFHFSHLCCSYSFLFVCGYFQGVCLAYAGVWNAGYWKFRLAGGGGGTALPNGIVFVAYLLNVSFMVALRILVKLLHELMSFDDRRCVS